ncbi:bifunctional folylpolyglutamate synthase/dihydrofolate synthase [Lutibacter sp. B2]|nr:bifunctional folylpolyglutamate synthase/dihydrofolate synthase [Lutibacter sp. B2]
MNYLEALEYIHGTYKFGSKLGLENIKYLLDLMDNPHKDLKIIHVAGTNGKGSTSNYIASVLKETGYKVGLFTSPYLEEFEERIRVDGKNISKEDLAKTTSCVKEKIEKMVSKGKNHPTEFEVVTAIGFEYFKREKVDYVVLEVGMGGRLDATNVIENPLVSVITPIALDHIDYLGDTVGKVAGEKAGIIKNDSYVVVHPQEDEAMEVVDQVCKEKNANYIMAPIETIEINKVDENGQCFSATFQDEKLENICISMLGAHQTRNATVAMTVLNLLKNKYNVKITKEALYEGMKKAVWPGRLEILRKEPTIIIDGAHNLHGVKALAKVLKDSFSDKNIILGLGILGDKDVSEMVKELCPLAQKMVLTEPNNPRKMKVDQLEEVVKNHCDTIYKKPLIKDAVQEVLDIAKADDLIVFAGSLYMIGEVRTLLKSK